MALVWHIPPGDSHVELPFRIRLDRWGRHRLGTVAVRLDNGRSVLHWAGEVDCDGQIRVLPTSERLHRLLEPKASRVTAGAHLSRQVGDGSDFAEIRDYQPGNRRRDINWRASSRSGRTMVNRRHPDRGGEVIVLVDTAADAYHESSAASRAVLSRMAQAAWAVALVHLSAADRVGFLAFGKVGAFLTPATGTRARHRLMDSLLAVGGAVAAGEAVAPPDPARVIPTSSLVIGVSPLTTHLIVDTLRELKAKGRNVVCIVPDLAAALPAAVGFPEHLARRLWHAGIANRIRLLQEVGIPVERWPQGTALGPVMRNLRQAQARRPRTVRT